MFATRYFADRMFAPRYFAKAGANAPSGGSGGRLPLLGVG